MLPSVCSALVTLAATTSALPLPQASNPGAVRPRNGHPVPGVHFPGEYLRRTAGPGVPFTLADLDGDGREDLVVISGDHVLLRPGLRGGRFDEPLDLGALASGLTTLVAGDLDQDGDVDLAGAVSANDAVRLLVNSGNGSLALAQDLAAGDLPVELVLVDVELDGDLDLVTANKDSDTVTLHRNLGGGTFAAASSSAVLDAPVALVCVDLGGSAAPDLALVGATGATLQVLTNDGTGAFLATQSLALTRVAMDVLAEDLNGDGFRDLVAVQRWRDVGASSDNGRMEWLRSVGGASYLPAALLASPRGPTASAFSDLDADGDLDLVYAEDGLFDPILGQEYSIRYLRNGGAGTFTQVQSFDAYPTNGLAARDLDGDDHPELVFASPDWLLVYANRNGAFPANTPHGQIVRAAALDDLDGDGDLDSATTVLEGGQPKLGIYLRNGASLTFQSFPGLDLTTALTAADLDDDGALDLAVGTSPLSVFKGQGDGTFLPYTSFATLDSVQRIDAADLNGDGLDDVVTLNVASSRASIFLNQGSGTLGSPTTYLSGIAPAMLRARDMNADGDLDLVVANQHSTIGGVTVMSNSGAGAFPTRVKYLTGVEVFGLDVADLDQDGDADVVAHDQEFILQAANNGLGVLSLQSSTPVDSVREILTADVDQDGRADLLHSSGWGIGWRRNQGGTFGLEHLHFIRTTVFPVPDQVLLFRDLDGDRDRDLISIYQVLPNLIR